jgi:23S rRNA maturation mini-RNase III
MEIIKINELVFAITLKDLQSESLEKIGRVLTDEEIHIAKKGLEFGLLTDIDTVYKTIFTEMIGNERN